MTTAYLLNTTPVRIAVNLNGELQNHILDPRSGEDDSTVLELPAWPAEYAASPDRGVLGGNGRENLLTVFSEQLPVPALYAVTSTVSTTLDVYLYVLGDTVVGADATGASGGITVKVVSPELAAQIRDCLLDR